MPGPSGKESLEGITTPVAVELRDAGSSMCSALERDMTAGTLCRLNSGGCVGMNGAAAADMDIRRPGDAGQPEHRTVIIQSVVRLSSKSSITERPGSRYSLRD